VIKTCKKCGEEFELKPGKPGLANVCEDCMGLHLATPLPAQPQPLRKPSNIRTATLQLLRAVEALDGRPDPALRALVQQLLNFRVSHKGDR
jgi:hypothetical protein